MDKLAEEVKEILSAEELAEYLGFSKNWVYRKAEAGELPGVKLGNKWRFKRSVIDRWLEERIRIEEAESIKSRQAEAEAEARARARAESRLKLRGSPRRPPSSSPGSFRSSRTTPRV